MSQTQGFFLYGGLGGGHRLQFEFLLRHFLERANTANCVVTNRPCHCEFTLCAVVYNLNAIWNSLVISADFLREHFSILGPQLCRLVCWVSDKHSQCSPGVSDSLLSSLLLLPLWAKGHGSCLTRFYLGGGAFGCFPSLWRRTTAREGNRRDEELMCSKSADDSFVFLQPIIAGSAASKRSAAETFWWSCACWLCWYQ